MFTALPPTLFCDDKLEKENASFVMVVGVQKQHENMVMNLPRYSQPNSNVMKKNTLLLLSIDDTLFLSFHTHYGYCEFEI